MNVRDARHLCPEAQEALRYRVVNAIKNGMRKSKAARVFKVSRTAIHYWTKAVEEKNTRALKSKKRGRRPQSRFAPYEAATIVRLILHSTPEQLGLPFALWTREAVRQLIEERYGISMSVWTVGRYLTRWGFTPQKPLRRAYEKDADAVKKWIEADYPAIARRAEQEGAEIHWGDEMGLRSDDQTGRSYGKRGHTPVIPGTGQRFRFNLLSTLNNQGRLYFMLFAENFTSKVMLTFLRRLIRQVSGKVFLLMDNHPVHRSGAIKRWLDKHVERIELFLFPSYSPELNPDELLNHDVKANAVGRKRPRTRHEMMENVRRYLQRRQRQPEIVRHFFQEKNVAYAA
jgi:transposase